MLCAADCEYGLNDNFVSNILIIPIYDRVFASLLIVASTEFVFLFCGIPFHLTILLYFRIKLYMVDREQ